jgi:hypothetical protein
VDSYVEKKKLNSVVIWDHIASRLPVGTTGESPESFYRQPDLTDFDPIQPAIPQHTSQILETVSTEMGS